MLPAKMYLKDNGPAFYSVRHSGIVITSDELLRTVGRNPNEPVKGIDFGNKESAISFCEYADRLRDSNQCIMGNFFPRLFFRRKQTRTWTDTPGIYQGDKSNVRRM